jgi:chromate transporter
MIAFELFARFMVVSLLVFGGGRAALPLVERLAVNDTGWVQPSTFGAAVAFSYVTRRPVLIASTFIGYRAAGIAGALAATLGAFLAPWALATAAAQQAGRVCARDAHARPSGRAARRGRRRRMARTLSPDGEGRVTLC